MPHIVETTVYCLNELSEAGRDKARTWYREAAFDDDWYDCVFDDFETICGILGVQLKTRPVPLFGGGGTHAKPCIYFTGFSSQGDGACFEAVYAYEKGMPRNIRAHAPQDTELHAIADALQAAQRRNFYQLRAAITHRGRYNHEYCMAILVERDSLTSQGMTAGAEDAVITALRNLARWLYRQLEREYEYQISNAVVDEAIIANDYTFTETGRRFG
jgi:hypothetical protein